MERMNTPGSVAWACMRMRSPRMAPPLKGEVGSTAMMPTVLPWRAQARGEPVHERGLARPGRAGDAHDQRAPGVREEPRPATSRASGRPSSTSVMARASARTSPPRTPATSAGTDESATARVYRTIPRRPRSSRAMTRRCTSLVPSPMVPSFESRR